MTQYLHENTKTMKHLLNTLYCTVSCQQAWILWRKVCRSPIMTVHLESSYLVPEY